MTAPQLEDCSKPYRGRRLSWEEFTKLTGRPVPKAANECDSIAGANAGNTLDAVNQPHDQSEEYGRKMYLHPYASYPY